MAIQEACAWCGTWFEKRGSQKYCCEECSLLAEKEQKKREYRKKTLAKTKAPSVSIEQIVDLMLRLSKERGYVVQYGEVQRELLTGKLKLNGGKAK